MRRDPQLPPGLQHYVERVIVRLCRRWELPLWALLVGTAWRAAPAPTVRMVLVNTLRRTIMYREAGVRRGVEYKRVGDSGLKTSREGGWRPLSTPRLAAILNLDHSAVVRMLKKARGEGGRSDGDE